MNESVNESAPSAPKSYRPTLVYKSKLAGAEQVAVLAGQLAERQPLRVWQALLFDYGVMLAALVGFQLTHALWLRALLWLPLCMLIGGRQHALAVLMHEASHGNLFKKRALNDWVGQVLCAYPLVIVSLYKYRTKHRLHHVHLNSSRDPDWALKASDRDWTYPASNLALLIRILKLIVGGGVYFLFKQQVLLKLETKHKEPHGGLGRVVYLTLAITAITYLNAWTTILFLWVIPLVTWLPLFERVRSVAEHFALPHDSDLTASRSLRATWLGRCFFAPHHVGLHLEHHLYPMVPFYNLPQLASALDRLPRYSEEAHITLGHSSFATKQRGLWRELRYV